MHTFLLFISIYTVGIIKNKKQITQDMSKLYKNIVNGASIQRLSWIESFQLDWATQLDPFQKNKTKTKPAMPSFVQLFLETEFLNLYL